MKKIIIIIIFLLCYQYFFILNCVYTMRVLICFSTFLPCISTSQQCVEDVIVSLSRVLSDHTVLEQKNKLRFSATFLCDILYKPQRGHLVDICPSQVNKGDLSYLFKQI